MAGGIRGHVAVVVFTSITKEAEKENKAVDGCVCVQLCTLSMISHSSWMRWMTVAACGGGKDNGATTSSV